MKPALIFLLTALVLGVVASKKTESNADDNLRASTIFQVPSTKVDPKLEPFASFLLSEATTNTSTDCLPCSFKKLNPRMRDLIESLKFNARKKSWTPENDIVPGDVQQLINLFDFPPNPQSVLPRVPCRKHVCKIVKKYERFLKSQFGTIEREPSLKQKVSSEETILEIAAPNPSPTANAEEVFLEKSEPAQERMKVEEIPEDIVSAEVSKPEQEIFSIEQVVDEVVPAREDNFVQDSEAKFVEKDQNLADEEFFSGDDDSLQDSDEDYWFETFNFLAQYYS